MVVQSAAALTRQCANPDGNVSPYSLGRKGLHGTFSVIAKMSAFSWIVTSGQAVLTDTPIPLSRLNFIEFIPYIDSVL